MSDAKLREYLEFNEADLRANQSGQVSEKQKERLAGRRKRSSKRWITVLGLLLAVPVVLFLWILKATVSAGLPLSAMFKILPAPVLVVGGIFTLVLLGLLLFVIFVKYDDTLKSMQGEVEYVRVERREIDHARSDSQHTVYQTVQALELRVGGSALADVDKSMMDVVQQGDSYKMYYSKDGGILSAEKIGKG